MLGKKIGDLINESESAGSHQYTYYTTSLAQGIYLYKMEAKGANHDFIKVKMLIVE